MTLSLTCTCGVRLEVDETFTGQTITCPDCHRPLEVPGRERGRLGTSGLALTSLILALVGAFTVVGTLLAILLGSVALAVIRGHSDRLAGRGYAVAAIVLGVLLTGLSLFAYSTVELFGLDALLREPQWIGKLDFDGPLVVKRPADGFTITRPSKQWGVLKPARAWDVGMGERDSGGVLLVNPKESAYVVCIPEEVQAQMTLEDCRETAEREFAALDLSNGLDRRSRGFRTTLHVHSKNLTTVRGIEGIEMIVDKEGRGQVRTYVLRVLKRREDIMMYIVAGGTRKDRFGRLEAEIRRALDSVDLTARNRPADMNIKNN